MTDMSKEPIKPEYKSEQSSEGKEGFLRGIFNKISGKGREVRAEGERITAEGESDPNLEPVEKQGIKEAVGEANQQAQKTQNEAMARITQLNQEIKTAQEARQTIKAAGWQKEKEYQQKEITIAQAQEKLADLKPETSRAKKTERQIRQKQAEQDIFKLRKEIAGLKQDNPELTQKRQELQTAKITAEKEKTIIQKAGELFTNKEVGKRFIVGQISALSTSLGLRAVYSLPTWLWQRANVKGEWGREGLQKHLEKTLAASQKRKNKAPEGTSQKAEMAEMMKIVKMTKEGGQKNSTLRKELADTIAKNRAENSLLNQQESAEIKKLIDKHAETKVNGLEVARDGLNSACVVGGAWYLRIFSKGLFDAANRYQRLQREAKPDQEVKFFRDAIAKGVSETFQKAAFAFGKDKTTKQRGLEFAQAASALMSYYGMGALSLLRPEVLTADIDRVIDTFSGGQDLGQMMENMGQNAFENAAIVAGRYTKIAEITAKPFRKAPSASAPEQPTSILQEHPQDKPLGHFKHPYHPGGIKPSQPEVKPVAEIPEPKPAAEPTTAPVIPSELPASEESQLSATPTEARDSSPLAQNDTTSFAEQFPSGQKLKESMLKDLQEGLAKKDEPSELAKDMSKTLQQNLGEETPSEVGIATPAETPIPQPKEPLTHPDNLTEPPKQEDFSLRQTPAIEKHDFAPAPEIVPSQPTNETLNSEILKTYDELNSKIRQATTHSGIFRARLLHNNQDIEFRHDNGEDNKMFYRLKGQNEWQPVSDLSDTAQAPYVPPSTTEHEMTTTLPPAETEIPVVEQAAATEQSSDSKSYILAPNKGLPTSAEVEEEKKWLEAQTKPEASQQPADEQPQPQPEAQPPAETTATVAPATELEAPTITDDTTNEVIKYFEQNDYKSPLLPLLKENQQIGTLYQEVSLNIEQDNKTAAQAALDQIKSLVFNQETGQDDYNIADTQNALIKLGFNPKDLVNAANGDEKFFALAWKNFLKNQLNKQNRQTAGVLLGQLQTLQAVKTFREGL
ncbi:hypothetical protein COS21_01685 [bacterium (Candidatus Gribaldobacteria) CG02_land_8_20_14_3_00_41_15]|uniref:Uncharacterized protein n=2 Tax=Candidatus Gribaldobacteria TaxID=2798536 RepID=A0A2M7DE16_9BACT|nr:MAG: hypothetical protein COS21_01685 [bacterium (Candidatus Gribaldobacteria) CG02_land_8_20_14_3_00_41_15]